MITVGIKESSDSIDPIISITNDLSVSIENLGIIYFFLSKGVYAELFLKKLKEKLKEEEFNRLSKCIFSFIEASHEMLNQSKLDMAKNPMVEDGGSDGITSL